MQFTLDVYKLVSKIKIKSNPGKFKWFQDEHKGILVELISNFWNFGLIKKTGLFISKKALSLLKDNF